MDLVCKDVRLFDKLTDKFNIPADISKLMVSVFEKRRLELGDRSFCIKIVKFIENSCKETLRANNFPKELTDDQPRKKGFEINF